MSFLDIQLQPLARRDARPFLEIVRNFTPNWFTVTMGTGALALTLNQFPLPLPGLRAVAVALWLANIALFALFSLLYAAPASLPSRGGADFRTSGDVDVLWRDPDGARYHRNGFLAFGPDFLGATAEPPDCPRSLEARRRAVARSWPRSSPISCSPPKSTRLEKLTAVWLLPVVAAEVAAASGATAGDASAASEAFLVIILSYACGPIQCHSP